jgi:hypothetical protein
MKKEGNSRYSGREEEELVQQAVVEAIAEEAEVEEAEESLIE